MTIEKSSATKEVSPASRGDVKASKNKVPGTEPGDGGALGDFMAILSTFDAPTSSATLSSELEGTPLVPQEALQDPTQVTLDNALQPMAAADAAWQDATQAGTLLLNQALQAGVSQPAVPSLVEDTALDGVAPMPQGVAGTRAPVAASDAAAKGMRAALAGQHTNPAALQQEAPSALASTPKRDKPNASASMSLSSAAAGSGWVPAAEIQTMLDARMGAIASKVDAMPNATTTLALLANTGTPVYREEDRRERFVFKPNITEGVTLAAPTGVSAAISLDVPSASAVPLDAYVAEQVKYWISNDVKNAEMKLDGLGGEMVEVSIRMQGNEAHVAFRSDESQTRAALETASGHLKDMLQREGVVLSGVSVGSSGAQDAGAQARREQQAAGQLATLAVPVEAAPELGRIPMRQIPGSGRSVDLFV